ncbi:MAG: ATP-binding protein [Leptolyngbya sp. SIO1E4]|nr:ATP-binding protein [Leptolyngbya sp. SIO1E4]
MSPPTLTWHSANRQYLLAHIARLHKILTHYIEGFSSSSAAGSLDVEVDLAPEVAAVLETHPAPFDRLGQLFHLNPCEQDTLLLCVGMELDPRFESLCLTANRAPNRNYPTLGLALAALPTSDARILSAEGPLQRWQLIELGEAVALTHAPLRINRRILCYLLNEPASEAQLQGIWSTVSTPLAQPLPPSHQALADRVAATWQQAGGAPPVLQLCGIDRQAKQAIAAAACQQQGWNLAQVKGGALPGNGRDRYQLAQHCLREALLLNSAVLLDCHEANLVEPQREAAILEFMELLDIPLIVSSRDRLPQPQRTVLTLDVNALTRPEQHALWQTHLATPADLNGQLGALVAQFNLSAAAIQTACASAQAGPTPDTPTDAPTLQQLWHYCRVQTRPHLEDLAQRIESHAAWADLVLPEPQMAVLHNIAIHVRQRAKVYQEWGFAGRSQRGLGISALFSGESGTGKTLAAEVLAQELHLDLYRIDLSAVVSKYIGETEKNLRRIFDAAEAGGAVLLFDEADALFGKRTEVKDSHDRHANVEVSYLLQRMEAFQGLAILTTNLKKSLDQAFMRRLRFIVDFPFPNKQSRTEIWRRIFPANTPTAALKYERLGNLNVSGGNIRSIAMNAAFLAAEAETAVHMSHILQATQQEYIKLDLRLTNSETQDWLTPSVKRR